MHNRFVFHFHVIYISILCTINCYSQDRYFKDISNWRQPLVRNNLNESRKLLRDYAVCKCIMLHSNERDLWKKDLSLSLLIDLGDYQHNAYRHIDSVTRIYVSQLDYSSLSDQKGMVLNCIDYYNSKELWQIIVGMDSCLIR